MHWVPSDIIFHLLSIAPHQVAWLSLMPLILSFIGIQSCTNSLVL